MTRTEFDQAVRSTPRFHPVFRVVRLPDWIVRNGHDVKVGDLLILRSNGALALLRDGLPTSNYGIAPSYLAFVEHRQVHIPV